jgi:hypothetical protein
MDKFKKLLDMFYPNKKGLKRPKNILMLLSLKRVKKPAVKRDRGGRSKASPSPPLPSSYPIYYLIR